MQSRAIPHVQSQESEAFPLSRLTVSKPAQRLPAEVLPPTFAILLSKILSQCFATLDSQSAITSRARSRAICNSAYCFRLIRIGSQYERRQGLVGSSDTRPIVSVLNALRSAVGNGGCGFVSRSKYKENTEHAAPNSFGLKSRTSPSSCNIASSRSPRHAE